MNLWLLMILNSTAAPDRVVVFPDRAQVMRTSPVVCGARVPVRFVDVPPAAAADSFRARLTNGTVDGLRSELVSQEKEYSPKAEALVKKLEELQRARATLGDQLTRSRLQSQLGRKYGEVASQLVSREMAVERPDVKAWQVAFDSSFATMNAASRSAAEAQGKLVELGRQEELVRAELDAMRSAANKKSWTVEVLASCPAGQTGQLTLTYVVGGASWAPSYEARADEASGHVEFSTWATITQGTGEDWSRVELTLSTAVPSQNATPPELKKLMLAAQEKAPEKKVLVRRDEAVEHAEVLADEGARSSGKLVAANQGLSVQLGVPEPTKVEGNGNPARVFVGRSKMNATFELRATPRLNPVAFRVAELNNQAAWPLLAGRVDVFRKSGLVGRYHLERVAQGAKFTLSFGVEDAVRVKRTVVEELKRDVGVISTKKRFLYGYRFELANYGKTPVDVALVDNLPVSEMSDIVVGVGEKTTAGYKLDPQDGLARWKVPLKVGEKKVVDFGYSVEVPSSYETGNL
jgi:uncharacterized protein (TIGR02231 family)